MTLMTHNGVLLLKMNKLCMLLHDTLAIVVVKLLYFGVYK